jgi:hypothetical protein
MLYYLTNVCFSLHLHFRAAAIKIAQEQHYSDDGEVANFMRKRKLFQAQINQVQLPVHVKRKLSISSTPRSARIRLELNSNSQRSSDNTSAGNARYNSKSSNSSKSQTDESYSFDTARGSRGS